MLELIIVIVVAGILAAVMIPRLERDNLREAANQLVRHIQYTQHLAMVDDVYNAGDTNWYKNRWSIDLCSRAYAVKRANGSETAADPLTKRDINGTDNNLADLGITAISPATGNCKITFDNLGRPYSWTTIPATPVAGLLNADATVTLNAGARTAVITITKETGFVKLTSFN